ncbi:GNAT family N-acetyltransferase [Agarivorans albus]|uniref:GNAT family N-acetyltransferase n=1 Tax=Agarivorans albus TaxID=182262 RepID=UPI00058CD039|nr:GNAT family N-acetyltransferase [Agarivorans albus]
MAKIEFVSFNQVEPADLLLVVNEPALRTHLVDHEYFDSVSIKQWMIGKAQTDSIAGCRVRVVNIDGVVAGWCGIQPDDNGYEIAIVVSKEYWGFGISIFNSMMAWAKELGHKEVVFHLLETRPEYKALKRRAIKVQKTELLDRSFTTYFISVDKWCAK